MAFTHLRILTEVPECIRYLETLTSVLPCSFTKLKDHAHSICPAIGEFCTKNALELKGRDKGSAGKLVEFYLFGQKPNSKSEADTLAGDIKATHVKPVLGKYYNAKERLTLTNVGSTADYSTLEHLTNSPTLQECRAYKKIGTGIMVVFKHTPGTYDTIEKTMEKEVVALFRYDISEMPEDCKNAIKKDFESIQQCIRDKKVSQSGQKYLHIHPHGSKGSSTRALGFTSKFVTELIAKYAGKELQGGGRSTYFSI